MTFAPNPQDLIPFPQGCRAWLISRTGQSAIGMPQQPPRTGGTGCQHLLSAHKCLLEGWMGGVGRNEGHKQTELGGSKAWTQLAGKGQPEQPISCWTWMFVSAIPLDLGIFSLLHPVHFSWDSCIVPSKKPRRSQAGFGTSPGDDDHRI